MTLIEQIKHHCMIGASTDKLRSLIAQLDVPVLWRVYVGSARGTSDVPSVTGHYHTTRYGELQEFTTSTAHVGDTIAYKHLTLTVIVNTHSKGDAHVPDTYYFIAIEEKQS